MTDRFFVHMHGTTVPAPGLVAHHHKNGWWHAQTEGDAVLQATVAFKKSTPVDESIGDSLVILWIGVFPG